MIVTVYPNGEVRAGLGNVRPVPRRDLGRVSPLTCLSSKTCDTKIAIQDAIALRPGYGALAKVRSFSLYARRMLARAGGCFAPASEGRLVFLTGTLPGGTQDAMRSIAKWSSWVVHEVLSRLFRAIGVKQSEVLWEWVWEYQKRGALHWHMAVELPTVGQAQRCLSKFRSVWCAVLRGVDSRVDCDLFERAEGGTHRHDESVWRVDAQVAIASPSQYLSKYLSKDPLVEGGPNLFPPTRWYGCSRALNRKLREETVVRWVPPPQGCPTKLCTVSDHVLDLIQRSCQKVIAFGQQYREAVTVVGYLIQEKRQEFMAEIKKIPSDLKGSEFVRSASSAIYRRIPTSIKILATRPDWTERFLNDIGDYHREQFQSLWNGRFVDGQEVAYLNHAAEVVLHLAGGYAIDGTPPSRRGAGLKSDRQRKLRRGG